MNNDNYVNPEHYKYENGRQVIDDIIEILLEKQGADGVRGYLRGSAMKYFYRAGRKIYEGKTRLESEQIDMQKRDWYMEKLNEFNKTHE